MQEATSAEVKWYTRKDVSDIELIGSSDEGTGYKGCFGSYGNVCIKVLNVSDENRKEEISNLDLFAKTNRHDNIVIIYGKFLLDDSFLAIQQYGYIMEFMEQGSLKSVIESKKGYSTGRICSWMAMAADGIQFLIERNVHYRNVRPTNMLLNSNYILKLSDFGICKGYYGKIKAINDNTCFYIAPEVLSGEGDVKSAVADVYAIGIIIWELFYRKPPYTEKRTLELCKSILNGERPSIDSLVSDEMQKLIERCWSHNTGNRPSLAELINFFKEMRSQEESQEVEGERRLEEAPRKKRQKLELQTEELSETMKPLKVSTDTPEMEDLQDSISSHSVSCVEGLKVEGPWTSEEFQDDSRKSVENTLSDDMEGCSLSRIMSVSNLNNTTISDIDDIQGSIENYENSIEPCLNLSTTPKYLLNCLTPYPSTNAKSGSFGIVTKVFAPSIRPGALKTIRNFLSEKEIDRWKRELESIAQLSHHPNIVALYGFVYETDTDLYPMGILMEYMSGGELCEYIHEQAGVIIDLQKNTWAKQIAFGLNFIHLRGFMHRDLRPNNILLSRTRFIAKIGGFHLARRFEPSAHGYTVGIGNPMYTAPEVYMEGGNYSMSADVWSYGMILYFIYYERNPYDYTILTKIAPLIRIRVLRGEETHPNMLMRPVLLGYNIDTVIEECWKTVPSDRYTMFDIVRSFDSPKGVELFTSVED